MGDFFPDQRWTSEGEPELGVGIVTEISKGRVRIDFPISGETRQYSIENPPLRRVFFKVGDTICDLDKRPMLIDRVEQASNLFIYYGDNRVISEANLGDVEVKHGVTDRLSLGYVDKPEIFALRRRTLFYDHRRRISAVNGFVGGRIDLIPHQLYIAHEVSSRYAPRVLLSDQVGLGKTIEASLILHRLLLSGRISRVLILVPDSLVHQWFVEMLRRFNLWFHIFDEERCEAIEQGAPDGNPFLENQIILCSTTFLAGSEIRTQQALSASWDMLVVDEAHHLAWSVDNVSTEYGVVELLSRVAKGLLLLTATPEQLGLQSHFARLRLLDPDRYSDFNSFKKESLKHKGLARIVEDLSLGRSLHTEDSKLLESLLDKERLQEISKKGDAGREDLIKELLDQHGPGRVIFRNTRSAMSGFPKRKVHLIPITNKDNNDPMLGWLIEMMEELQTAKVLLICQTKEKVLALEKAIGKRINLKVGVFHEELSIVQRDRSAAWFSESDGARLLLCSEIGSEGRNFQFAHHLILYDLPLHPELLEQRIGRLDRIGQKKDIQIYVPYILGSSQEVLVRWYHEGLNAFEENLEGGNQLAQVFSDRLQSIAKSSSKPNAQKRVETLIKDTFEFQQELKVTLADGRDRLLEMNSFHPKIAKSLIKQIKGEDRDTSLEIFMSELFENFGVETEDLAPRTYLLHSSPLNREAFPTIPREGVSVTFDRKRALSREDMVFVTWDHPLVTGAIDMVLSSGTGSASFGLLRGAGSQGILLEALFVLETIGGSSSHIDRFLPSTPLRVVVDHTGKLLTEAYPVDFIDQQIIPGQIDELVGNEIFMETILPIMTTAATNYSEELGSVEISNGLQRMNLILNHEIDRLKSLQKKNKDIRPDEIQSAVNAQSNLSSLIKNARIRLDAIRVIWKVE